MKILVLGATGMLGHKLVQQLSSGHEVWGTVRGPVDRAPEIQGVERKRLIGGVSASDLDSIRRVMQETDPDSVLNCIGVVKQIGAAKDAVISIGVNALLPHQLAEICLESGARLVHFSTDCVFSGRGGPYGESDLPDPVDLYGRTKLLGEVDRPGSITLRTSIIGRELRRGTGLLEWFLSQTSGRVRGFRNALYTGLTTQAMADVVRTLLTDYPGLSGIWQVSSHAISKYDLLQLVNRIYDLGTDIDEDTEFFCDRRLDSSPFRVETHYSPPSWEEMIEQMHADPLV